MNAQNRSNPRPGSIHQQDPLRLDPYPLTRTHTAEEHARAANESRARSRFEHFRDPLWFITIGMGTFFGLVAFLLALS